MKLPSDCKPGHKRPHGVAVGSCCENCPGPSHTLQYHCGIVAGRIDVDVRSEILRKLFLVAATTDCHGMESHVPRKLDAKMPQTTNALHGHKISATQAGVAKSVISRDARAQERGGLCGTELIRNRSDAARFSDHHFRVSPVDSYSGYHRVLTIHHVSASARLTHTVFAGDQSDTNPLTDLPFRHSAAQGFDAPNNLMPGHAGQELDLGYGARDGGGIGVTDSACFHANANLTRSRLRDLPFDYVKNAGCGNFDCFVVAFHLSICAFLNLSFEHGGAERLTIASMRR